MVILIIGQENPSGSRIQSSLETVDYYTQLFPGPPESLEPDRFSCCPRDHSLFVINVRQSHI